MRYSPELGRSVELRDDTSDQQVYQDVFVGLYHVPPPWMPAPATVLDLGANIGLTAAHYAKLWPSAVITAVEMDEANAVQAALNWRGGLVIPGAVVVNVHDRAGYDPTLAAEGFAIGTGQAQPPARFTLVDLCHIAAGIAPVGFVKMDVEGMEWHLLDDGEQWALLVQHLLVELHGVDDVGRRVARARKQLVGLGYTVQASTHPAGLFAWRKP